MSLNTAVYGLCKDRPGIKEVMACLRQGGFRNTDIAVLFAENPGSMDFSHRSRTKAPVSGVIGASLGAVLAVVYETLARFGMSTVPRGGPLVNLMAAVGLGGALGMIVGAFIGMGIPEYVATRFNGRINAGGILFSVHCDNLDWVRRAKDLLKETSAERVASRPEAAADFLVTDKPLPAATEQAI